MADNKSRFVTEDGEVKNEFCNDFQYITLVNSENRYFDNPMTSVWQLDPVNVDNDDPRFHIEMPYQ